MMSRGSQQVVAQIAREAIKVSASWMRSPLLPQFSNGVAGAIRDSATRKATRSPAAKNTHVAEVVKVMGYTTPAVRDIGGASLRISGLSGSWKAGGYLLGIRFPRAHAHSHLYPPFEGGNSGWLPAIAGVPNEQGLDRYGNSRKGMAEIMVMARPIVAREGKDLHHDDHSNNKKIIGFSFLPEEILREASVAGGDIEVMEIERVTDFHLGLNAGRWLCLRMSQICKENSFVRRGEEQRGTKDDGDGVDAPTSKKEQVDEAKSEEDQDTSTEEFFKSTGLVFDRTKLEEPPMDASYLFDHLGGSANAGVSGQKILRKVVDERVIFSDGAEVEQVGAIISDVERKTVSKL
ncbi:unnamed protein product [Amoebophrya sp. A25]|nr:unnamed protein product [Amoebophrya sp. A25]|eukprot:GSA25T00021042001.1